MSDSITEVTSESWFSRIIGSIKGIAFGLLLLVGGTILIYWNEGNTVKIAESLAEGAGIVVPTAAGELNPANEGKLVHFIGDTTTTDVLADAELGVKVNAIKLKRKVEMYQWEEKKSSRKKSKIGGGTETVTTYEYSKRWSNRLIQSSSFKDSSAHTNPEKFLFREQEQVAQNVTVGAFKLNPTLINDLASYEKLPVDSQRDGMKISDGAYYLGNYPTSPEVGDNRISFEVVKPSRVTVVAKQIGNTLEPYLARSGRAVNIIMNGDHSAEEVFKIKQEANKMNAWMFRAIALAVLFFGYCLLMQPIVVLSDVVPFFGSLVGAGTTFVAGVLAIVTFTVVFSLSWLSARPMLVGVVAAGAFAVIIVLRKVLAKPEAQTQLSA